MQLAFRKGPGSSCSAPLSDYTTLLLMSLRRLVVHVLVGVMVDLEAHCLLQPVSEMTFSMDSGTLQLILRCHIMCPMWRWPRRTCFSVGVSRPMSRHDLLDRSRE